MTDKEYKQYWLKQQGLREAGINEAGWYQKIMLEDGTIITLWVTDETEDTQ
jgi:hypothetical protein